jgi:hypothetical protein
VMLSSVKALRSAQWVALVKARRNSLVQANPDVRSYLAHLFRDTFDTVTKDCTRFPSIFVPNLLIVFTNIYIYNNDAPWIFVKVGHSLI